MPGIGLFNDALLMHKKVEHSHNALLLFTVTPSKTVGRAPER